MSRGAEFQANLSYIYRLEQNEKVFILITKNNLSLFNISFMETKIIYSAISYTYELFVTLSCCHCKTRLAARTA